MPTHPKIPPWECYPGALGASISWRAFSSASAPSGVKSLPPKSTPILPWHSPSPSRVLCLLREQQLCKINSVPFSLPRTPPWLQSHPGSHLWTRFSSLGPNRAERNTNRIFQRQNPLGLEPARENCLPRESDSPSLAAPAGVPEPHPCLLLIQQIPKQISCLWDEFPGNANKGNGNFIREVFSVV